MKQTQHIKIERIFNDTPLVLETGFLARQATSSVLATYGQTTVLASVVIGNKTNLDYLPLQVIYEERLYASGKIKGSRFIKREGKPTDTAILTGRLIDRSLRSLFNPAIQNEIQVIITVLSIDEINPPDTLSVLASSTALSLCQFDAPNTDTPIFAGPVSSVRIGLKPQILGESIIKQIEELIRKAVSFDQLQQPLQEIASILNNNSDQDKKYIQEIFSLLMSKNPQWANNYREIENKTPQLSHSELSTKYKLTPEYIVQPSYDQMKLSQLDIVVSGNGSSIAMIEAGANIISETVINHALDCANSQLKSLTLIQQEFISEYHKVNTQKTIPISILDSNEEYNEFWNSKMGDLEKILYSNEDKTKKNQLVEEFYSNQKNHYSEQFSDIQNQQFEKAFHESKTKLVHSVTINKKTRLDGRSLDQVRDITCITGLLPRTHGSSVFQRGETQVLNVLTLGTFREGQILDEMEDFEEQTKRYIHHYNFPAYSVGEIGRYTGPGRREIGHGALAEKALLPVLPSHTSFPYTMRLVSECLGSNGSTSMASTCASCLSLLDGGVPITAMVAGIAMGLIYDQTTKTYEVLTDIQGAEDHYGDMDFKVAGTADGITALQLDNKIQGLPIDVIKTALNKALEGRIHILSKMKEVISQPRNEISQYAPRVETLEIPQEKIGEVIGPSGKVIKGLIQKYDVQIDIDDITSLAYIYGKDSQKVQSAKTQIKQIIKGYTIGDIVQARVFRIENYGAFVKLEGGEKEGLIHISEIANKKITKVEDVLTIGQEITAIIIDINDKNKISLSIRKLST